jgi:hypothetical protein
MRSYKKTGWDNAPKGFKPHEIPPWLLKRIRAWVRYRESLDGGGLYPVSGYTMPRILQIRFPGLFDHWGHTGKGYGQVFVTQPYGPVESFEKQMADFAEMFNCKILPVTAGWWPGKTLLIQFKHEAF